MNVAQRDLTQATVLLLSFVGAIAPRALWEIASRSLALCDACRQRRSQRVLIAAEKIRTINSNFCEGCCCDAPFHRSLERTTKETSTLPTTTALRQGNAHPAVSIIQQRPTVYVTNVHRVAGGAHAHFGAVASSSASTDPAHAHVGLDADFCFNVRKLVFREVDLSGTGSAEEIESRRACGTTLIAWLLAVAHLRRSALAASSPASPPASNTAPSTSSLPPTATAAILQQNSAAVAAVTTIPPASPPILLPSALPMPLVSLTISHWCSTSPLDELFTVLRYYHLTLRHVALTHATWSTKEESEKLVRCFKVMPNVERLDLSRSTAVDRGALVAKGFHLLPKLNTLRLSRSMSFPLTGSVSFFPGLHHYVETFPQLTCLDLSGSLDVNLSFVAPMVPNLQSLVLVNTPNPLLRRSTGFDLTPLSALANLARLDLSKTEVADLEGVASLPSLKTLILGDVSVSEKRPASEPPRGGRETNWLHSRDLRPLTKCCTLRHVRANGLALSASGVRGVGKHLETLCLLHSTGADLTQLMVGSDGDDDDAARATTSNLNSSRNEGTTKTQPALKRLRLSLEEEVFRDPRVLGGWVALVSQCRYDDRQAQALPAPSSGRAFMYPTTIIEVIAFGSSPFQKQPTRQLVFGIFGGVLNQML